MVGRSRGTEVELFEVLEMVVACNGGRCAIRFMLGWRSIIELGG